jgi:hypothetical protein
MSHTASGHSRADSQFRARLHEAEELASELRGLVELLYMQTRLLAIYVVLQRPDRVQAVRRAGHTSSSRDQNHASSSEQVEQVRASYEYKLTMLQNRIAELETCKRAY